MIQGGELFEMKTRGKIFKTRSGKRRMGRGGEVEGVLLAGFHSWAKVFTVAKQLGSAPRGLTDGRADGQTHLFLEFTFLDLVFFNCHGVEVFQRRPLSWCLLGDKFVDERSFWSVTRASRNKEWL